MVQHNDKWKKKATREYHKKHGTQPASRGRGRGRGFTKDEPIQDLIEPGDTKEDDEDHSGAYNDSNEESGEEDIETRPQRSKYARRKIESNAWRFESEEPDPYLRIPRLTHLIKVIDEADLEPPEPDYAHLPARQFQTKSQLKNTLQTPLGVGRGKKHTIKETELAPLKEQIDKANAARAFKERFSSGPRGNVVTVGQDGVARRQQKAAVQEEPDEDVDDIDKFLAELDMQQGIPGSCYALTSRIRSITRNIREIFAAQERTTRYKS